MTQIIITRADELLATLETKTVAAVLSIEHPGVEKGQKGSAPRLAEHGFGHIPQRVLAFWDSEQIVHNGPDPAQVAEGVAFVLEHLGKGPVLVHCHAGKSRSVAIVLGALALAHPEQDENFLIEKLLEIRAISAPNILVVEMVDALSGRAGRLLRAVLDHPVLTAQRAQAEANRQKLLEDRPELLQKLYPEKFPKP